MTELVEYIQHWGGDLTTVNAARVSMGKRKGEFDEKDAKLIKYLADHGHTTPFRHAGATFCITCPMFIARQIHKHQVGISINEMSGRYVQFEDDAYWTPDTWRSQSASVKQGSDGEVEDQNTAHALYSSMVKSSVRTYNNLIKLGVCKEQARAVLPQGMLTQFWMTGTLQAWAHFYKLRIDSHAQEEIREYAIEAGKVMEDKFPVSWRELTK
jgi:thymidylate synthase (FAD)